MLCARVCVCAVCACVLTLSSTSEVGRSWGIFCRQESTKLRKESDLHVTGEEEEKEYNHNNNNNPTVGKGNIQFDDITEGIVACNSGKLHQQYVSANLIYSNKIQASLRF